MTASRLILLTWQDQVLRHSSVSWRQWRTMAPFAARLTGIRQFDGLIVTAAELFRIVRASYLNPSFPFFLGFELWQYLWRQVQRGTLGDNHRRRCKETSSTAGLPSRLRLVRAAAFAITVMLPAEGWAQVPDPQPGGAPAQQNKTSSSNGPCFPRDRNDRCNFSRCVEAGRAPAHFRRGAKLQHGREFRWRAQYLTGTRVSPDVQKLCRSICFRCRRVCSRS